jgi:hypothetical protein
MVTKWLHFNSLLLFESLFDMFDAVSVSAVLKSDGVQTVAMKERRSTGSEFPEKKYDMYRY